MTVQTKSLPTQSTDSFPEYKDNIDKSTRVHDEVAGNFAPHEAATPDMTIVIDSGKIQNGTDLAVVGQQIITALVAPVTNPRIDRIVIDSTTGIYTTVAGTEAVTPVAPAIPADKISIAQVYLVVSQTTILNADLTDERALFLVLGGGGGVTNPLIIGVEDTTAGVITAHGAGTGVTEGGRLNLHNAADHDTTYNLGFARMLSGNLELGFDTTVRATFKGNGDFDFNNRITYTSGINTISMNAGATGTYNLTGSKLELATDSGDVELFLNKVDVLTANTLLSRVGASWDGSSAMYCSIDFLSGVDTTNFDDGHISFKTSETGTLVERARVYNDGGVTVGSPTGASQGAGTINCTGIYVNGASVGGLAAGAFGDINDTFADVKFTTRHYLEKGPMTPSRNTANTAFTYLDGIGQLKTTPAITSTMTAGSTGSRIVDSTKSWTIDEHIGHVVDVQVDGAGNRRGAYVIANSATELVLDRELQTEAPTVGWAYYLNGYIVSNDNGIAGLMVEHDTTNRTLHNRDLTNVAWVKTTMTVLKDQTGLDGVASACSSILATAANATVLQSHTLAVGWRSYSVDIKRLVGTGTVEITMDGGTSWTDVTSQINTLNRPFVRVSMRQNQLNPQIGIRLGTSGDKLAVDYNQLEDGFGATSRVETTTVAVARNTQGSASISYKYANTNIHDDFTRVLDVCLYGGAFSSLGAGIYTVVNNNDELEYFSTDGINFYLRWSYNGGVKITGTTPLTLGVRNRVAVRNSGGTFTIWLNGVLEGTDVEALSTVVSASISLGSSTTKMNGKIIRYRDYNFALTDEQMRTV